MNYIPSYLVGTASMRRYGIHNGNVVIGMKHVVMMFANIGMRILERGICPYSNLISIAYTACIQLY